MLDSILKSEGLVRQISFNACPRWWDNGTCDAFAISQLVDDTTESLSQAIFTIYEYSSDVLSQYNANYEILQPIWDLAEEVAQCDSISVAQQTVEEWVSNNTEC